MSLLWWHQLTDPRRAGALAPQAPYVVLLGRFPCSHYRGNTLEPHPDNRDHVICTLCGEILDIIAGHDPRSTPSAGSTERITMRKILTGGLGLMLAAAAALSACVPASGLPDGEAGAPAASVAHAAPPSEGTLSVPRDIAPGTYTAVVPSDSLNCYWARLKGTGGQLSDIIANGNVRPKGRALVTIKATDKAFETTGCGVWARRGAAPAALLRVEPAAYRVPAVAAAATYTWSAYKSLRFVNNDGTTAAIASFRWLLEVNNGNRRVVEAQWATSAYGKQSASMSETVGGSTQGTGCYWTIAPGSTTNQVTIPGGGYCTTGAMPAYSQFITMRLHIHLRRAGTGTASELVADFYV